MNLMFNDKDKKNLYKRFSFENFEDDLKDELYLSDENNKTSMKDLLLLPVKFNKMNISKDDTYNVSKSTYIGSKSTHATSKKTHTKLTNNSEIIKDDNNLILSNNLKNDSKTEKKIEFISDKTKRIIENIKNKVDSNLILQNNNEIKYPLLKSIYKTKNPNIIISEKTKSIMNLLKSKKIGENNKKESNKNNIIIEDSKCQINNLNYKFEELVSKPRQLPLPTKYKIIYDNYSSLENFISLCKIKKEKNSNTFYKFREYMKDIKKNNFTINNLKQILYVAPQFFIIKYITINVQNEPIYFLEERIYKNHDILIDIPKNYRELMVQKFPKNFNYVNLFYYNEDSINYDPLIQCLDYQNLKERNNFFLNKLISIVNKYHNEYLNKNKIIRFFDPLKEKTWYHGFNLESDCKDIPILDFPPPKIKLPNYEVEIQNMNIKNSILKDAIEKTLNDNSKIKIKNKNKYVSNEFLNKLKRKEEIKQITDEMNEIERNKQNKIDICNFYVEVLIQIKTILFVNKNSLTLTKFSDALLNSSPLIKNTVDSIEHLGRIVIELSKLFHDLFTIEHNSLLGNVVVPHNRQFKIPSNLEIEKLFYNNRNDNN
mgnify:CR=1 FL=1